MPQNLRLKVPTPVYNDLAERASELGLSTEKFAMDQLLNIAAQAEWSPADQEPARKPKRKR